MRALIIDRDDTTAHLLKSRLEGMGVTVTYIPDRTQMGTHIDGQVFDIVFIDPAPMKTARPMMVELRRQIPTYFYAVLMGTDLDPDTTKESGAHEILQKPLSAGHIDGVIESAKALLEVQKRLNNPSEDFPSGGGIISKSAFCQLFLSAMDRADRYAEKSHILFISLVNFNQIKVTNGDYAANAVAAAIAQQIARIRRQSDILGQTGKYEYALLLQRPVYDSEPVDAALRFADTLAHSKDLRAITPGPIDLKITLMDIPSGYSVATHEISVTV